MTTTDQPIPTRDDLQVHYGYVKPATPCLVCGKTEEPEDYRLIAFAVDGQRLCDDDAERALGKGEWTRLLGQVHDLDAHMYGMPDYGADPQFIRNVVTTALKASLADFDSRYGTTEAS
jgi:hypothetical protein